MEISQAGLTVKKFQAYQNFNSVTHELCLLGRMELCGGVIQGAPAFL
jgi:hypothetical protein